MAPLLLAPYAIHRAGYHDKFQGILRIFKMFFVYKICTLLVFAMFIPKVYVATSFFITISLIQAIIRRILGKNILSYGH